MVSINSVISGAPWSGDVAGDIESRNPADLGDIIATASLGTGEVLAEAARRAAAAQVAWGQVPAPVRGETIHAMGEIFRANKEDLAQLVTREIGKPIAESRGEVQEAIDTCTFFASEGRRLYGQTVPSEMPDKQLFTFRRPVGTMVIITAGNFPVAVPSWYFVPALVAGNALVWKPAEYTPAIAAAVTGIVHAAGVPVDVFQMVLAGGGETFRGLEVALGEGSIDKVGFTGSSEVGRSIAEVCGRHLVHPTLELGGKNPLVVMPDADLDLAVEGSLFSGFGTAGQRCTSLGVAIVHESIHGDFVARFDAAVRGAAVGDPREEVLYGPMISERFAKNYEGWLEHIEGHHTVLGSEGVGRISSSNPRAGFVGDPDKGVYEHPVIVDGVTSEDVLYRNETFGPIVPVAQFDTMDEAVALANGHGYGLSAAIYTNAPRTVFEYRDRISAGMVSINNSTSGAEAHLPFGGNGKSGNGARQSGIWMLDQVTRWQSMNWDYSGHLQRAQMDIDIPESRLDHRI